MNNRKNLRLIDTDTMAKYAIITDNNWIYNIAFNMFEENVKQLRGAYGVKGALGNYRNLQLSLIEYGTGSSELMMILEELFRLGVRVIVKIGYGIYTLTEKPHVRVVTGAIRMDKLTETILPVELPAVASYDVLSQVVNTFNDESIEHETGIVLSTGYSYPHFEENLYPSWWRKHGVNLIDVDTATLYVVGYYRRIKTVSVVIPSVSTGEVLEKGSWIMYQPTGREVEKHEKIIGAVFEAIYHSREKALLDKKTREIRKSLQH